MQSTGGEQTNATPPSAEASNGAKDPFTLDWLEGRRIHSRGAAIAALAAHPELPWENPEETAKNAGHFTSALNRSGISDVLK